MSLARQRTIAIFAAMPTSTETEAVLPDKDTCLALYRQMLVIRRCEEQLARSYQAGLIPGACHTYVGEEAIATGVCAHLNDDDAVFSTHRGHGHALAKGVPPKELIAELFGKATGCSQGRGGLHAPLLAASGDDGHQRHRRPLHPPSCWRWLLLSSSWASPRLAWRSLATGR